MKQHRLYEAIKEAIQVNRDYLRAKDTIGTQAERVLLTTNAPQDVIELSQDGSAYIVSLDPLRIDVGGNIIDAEPNWIVLESKQQKDNDVSNIVRKQIDIFRGNVNLVEFVNNIPRPAGATSAQLAYAKERYDSPAKAYEEFKRTNKSAANGVVDTQTVKQFLNVVYKGGDHNVSIKKFLDFLKSRGVEVTNRRQNKLQNMEKV